MAFKTWTASAEQLAPDPRFGSKLVSRFVNCMMWEGKRRTALDIFYAAMDIVADKVKDVSPLAVFEKAVDNVKPMIEVRSRRVGGSNYQVPMQVSRKRQLSLGMRWLIQAVRGGKGSPTSQRLAAEVLAAYKREGTAMSTRENVHRMAFAHFAW